MLPRSKLNSIESKISEALMNNRISHEDFMTTPQNEQLDEELFKPIIRKSQKMKVYSAFKDNIWGADLADMQLLSTFDKGFRFLVCVIDIFSKYAWVVPLKDKEGVSVVNAFQDLLGH